MRLPLKFVGTRYCRVATGTPIRSAPARASRCGAAGLMRENGIVEVWSKPGAGVRAEALERAAGLDLHAAQPAGAGEQLGVDPRRGRRGGAVRRPPPLVRIWVSAAAKVVLADERAGAEALRRGLRLDGLGDDLRAARRARSVATSTRVDEPDDRGREAAEDREQDDDRDQAASAGLRFRTPRLGVAGRGAARPRPGRRTPLSGAAERGPRGRRRARGVAVSAGRAGGVLARVLGALRLPLRRRGDASGAASHLLGRAARRRALSASRSGRVSQAAGSRGGAAWPIGRSRRGPCGGSRLTACPSRVSS